MSLLVVGSVAFDQIETPFGKTGKIIGGAGSYISLAAAHFSDDVALISVVGEDFPKSFLDRLNTEGVNTKGVEVVKGRKSFFWSGKYHNDMNTRDTLVTELNVLGDFNPVVPKEFRSPDFLMLGNLSPQVQMEVISQIEKRPKLVVLDTMNFWMDMAWDELIAVIRKVDVVTINDEEARQLSGEYSLVKAAQKILDLGPKYLVIKKGEHGALLFNRAKEVFFAPALPLEEVFDPTGAGDSFAGGFLGYLSATRDVSFRNMKRAIIFGSAMASFTVEKFGLERLENLTSNEMDERVQEFIDLVQFDIALV
ncbi:MAG TPA: sugar kinase [Flavobacteriales bacterium]|jgi:sugar/nucleoside kinase (ribokinase family)|nr:sugar kinase [Flavobacteriales bacterium]